MVVAGSRQPSGGDPALGFLTMRTMFLIWSGVIIAGVVLFSIIGLSHH
ncbi:MAG TPA: hypothetical protein VE401_11955 [Solirubrobacterales bacterium]|nr:hypothetical protein [Solirubrobacterales bacterium]